MSFVLQTRPAGTRFWLSVEPFKRLKDAEEAARAVDMKAHDWVIYNKRGDVKAANTEALRAYWADVELAWRYHHASSLFTYAEVEALEKNNLETRAELDHLNEFTNNIIEG